MKNTLLLYGLFLGILAFVLKITEYWFWVKLNAFDVYALLIAAIFLGAGIWLGRNSFVKSKLKTDSQAPNSPVLIETKTVSEQLPFKTNETALEKIGISKREYEVLILLGRGMSNQEIADTLFVSQNTIKTHTSRIFEKLDVKNRTHAIIKAKTLGLIAD